MGILIFFGIISIITLAILFIPKNDKIAFFLYIWIVISFPIYILGYIQYWDYTHPMSEDFGMVIVLGIMFIFAIVIIVLVVIAIILTQSLIDIFKWFIIPLIIISILFYILFQGYLLLSAYNAYESAKHMKAKNVDTQDMYDFYSPSIEYIRISAGNPERDYRWSYHRNRYVFEIRQYTIHEAHPKDKNDTIYYFPDNQYKKEYQLSIPKPYLAKTKYNILEEITIPTHKPLSHYFNFDKKLISIQTYHYNISTSIDKKLEKQYGLKKGIDTGYYDDDNRKKYGNNYLTYYNETVSIKCHYFDHNIISDTCHMKMIVNDFKYEFDIYKQYIPQWQKIYTGLSKQFESFIVGVKQYPEKLNPYSD